VATGVDAAAVGLDLDDATDPIGRLGTGGISDPAA
jgi:hypothetical protein